MFSVVSIPGDGGKCALFSGIFEMAASFEFLEKDCGRKNSKEAREKAKTEQENAIQKRREQRIGYMILAGIMGIKWGLLYRITGNLWAGLGDHLFYNTVVTNMLHVVSLKGTDELLRFDKVLLEV